MRVREKSRCRGCGHFSRHGVGGAACQLFIERDRQRARGMAMVPAAWEVLLTRHGVLTHLDGRGCLWVPVSIEVLVLARSRHFFDHGGRRLLDLTLRRRMVVLGARALRGDTAARETLDAVLVALRMAEGRESAAAKIAAGAVQDHEILVARGGGAP